MIWPIKFWLFGILSFHQLPMHGVAFPTILVEHIEQAFVETGTIGPVVSPLRESADGTSVVPISHANNQFQLPLVHQIPIFPTDPDAGEHAAVLARSAVRNGDFVSREDVWPDFFVVGRDIAMRSSDNGTRWHPAIVSQPEGNDYLVVNFVRSHFIDKEIRTDISGVSLRDKLQPSLGVVSATPSLIGGISSVDRRTNSRDHRNESKRQTQSPNNCLLVGEDGRCFGGLRRTSLLYKIISLQAVFFFGFFTAYSAFLAFPPGKRVNRLWLAVVPASAIIGCLALVASVTSKIWLFGI